MIVSSKYPMLAERSGDLFPATASSAFIAPFTLTATFLLNQCQVGLTSALWNYQTSDPDPPTVTFRGFFAALRQLMSSFA